MRQIVTESAVPTDILHGHEAWNNLNAYKRNRFLQHQKRYILLGSCWLQILMSTNWMEKNDLFWTQWTQNWNFAVHSLRQSALGQCRILLISQSIPSFDKCLPNEGSALRHNIKLLRGNHCILIPCLNSKSVDETWGCPSKNLDGSCWEQMIHEPMRRVGTDFFRHW